MTTAWTRGLFDELLTQGWPRVMKLVTDGEEESVHLDFKEVKPSSIPSQDDYIREKFARALSGFANTGGGVLIYGIKTNGSPKGTPDRAQAVVEIDNVAAFRADLEQLANALVEPLIPYLDVKEIESPASRGRGVVCIYVPQSNGGPHRATRTKVKGVDEHYYARMATEFDVMPHALLADRFGRSANPRLRLTARFVNIAGPATILLRIENLGRGVARRPAVLFREAPNLVGWNTNSQNPTTRFVTRTLEGAPNARTLLEPYEDYVLYPGMDRLLVQLSHPTSKALRDDRLRVRFRGTLYALDAQPIDFDGELDRGDEFTELAYTHVLSLPPEGP